MIQRLGGAPDQQRDDSSVGRVWTAASGAALDATDHVPAERDRRLETSEGQR